MVQPLAKPKRVKKFGLKKFNRHQHDRKIAVKVGDYSLSVCRQVSALLYSLKAWKAPRCTENRSLCVHRQTCFIDREKHADHDVIAKL